MKNRFFFKFSLKKNINQKNQRYNTIKLKSNTIFLTFYSIIFTIIFFNLSSINIENSHAQEYNNFINSTNKFKTNHESYIQVISPKNSSIIPILTTGDVLTSGYEFPGIPDGIGVIEDKKNRLVEIFINHELKISNVNEYAKISKITTDNEGRVIFGKLLEDGSGNYQALCSSSLVKNNAFDNPLLLTNEEHSEGLVIAYDTITEKKIEMPWLGIFSHENTIIIPNLENKILAISSEDGKRDQSQLYAFLSNSSKDFLDGKGQLYVLVGDNNNTSSFRDIQKGIKYDGYFKAVSWDWKTENSTNLENKVQKLNAIDFIKLEDIEYNKNDNSVFYLADTGTNEIGENYKNGRIYEFKFNQLDQISNSMDRFNVSFSIILDGDMGDDMRNPDNLGSSKKSLMIQEDLSDYNRIDNGVNARILKYDLSTFSLEPVAIIDQIADSSEDYITGQWESSGIVETFDEFGQGSWLLNIQTHAPDEGGQLLLMNIPKS